MEIIFSDLEPTDEKIDLLGCFVGAPPEMPSSLTELDERSHGMIRRELERGRVRPGKGDVHLVPTPTDGHPERLALFSIGTETDGHEEALRCAGARLASTSKTARAGIVGMVMPAATDEASSEIVLARLVEGFMLGAYRYEPFKKSSRVEEVVDEVTEPVEERAKHPHTLVVFGANEAARSLAERAVTLAAATNWARDLANTPSNHLTPQALAREAASLAESHDNLTFHALDRNALEQRGFGLMAAVAQGSHNNPSLIVLEWNPPGATETDDERFAYVGKAVTFDTGGISIKPSVGMQDMKLDKSGGCAVLGAMRAIAELDIQHRVVAIVGAVENMPGGRAYKPGDVLTAFDGSSVEVINTDAEGRLVIADAICYARELGCGRIVELSTLTGAMVIALGHHYSGMITRKSDLSEDVLASAERTGDHAWHMPMHDFYRRSLKSDCADMVNSAGRDGSSLYAGLFLEHFARETPFVHLDVAGTAMLPKPQGAFTVRGASGWGVRLLTDLLENARPTGESE